MARRVARTGDGSLRAEAPPRTRVAISLPHRPRLYFRPDREEGGQLNDGEQVLGLVQVTREGPGELGTLGRVGGAVDLLEHRDELRIVVRRGVGGPWGERAEVP